MVRLYLGAFVATLLPLGVDLLGIATSQQLTDLETDLIYASPDFLLHKEKHTHLEMGVLLPQAHMDELVLLLQSFLSLMLIKSIGLGKYMPFPY